MLPNEVYWDQRACRLRACYCLWEEVLLFWAES